MQKPASEIAIPDALLEILEHLLKSIYILPKRNEALRNLRTKRGAKVS